MGIGRDTICAVATGLPPTAIATIRVSGPLTQSIIGSVLSVEALVPRYATYVSVLSSDRSLIDTGIALFFCGPKSYTGEDTLELSVHGGRISVEKTLDRIMQAGARLAEPGEFTRQAFENEKLDLTRAEGIVDLIEAESVQQHNQALKQLSGALEILYESWRLDLIGLLALLEASIDFPDEEDAPLTVDAPVAKSLQKLKSDLKQALADGHISEKIRDGFNIAIVGLPNAGKSSLLNVLSGRDAAIVTDIPGTTRDVVEVRMSLGGHLVRFQDTAGLRETQDKVELEGIRRAKKTASEADLTIWVYDVSRETNEKPEDMKADIIVATKQDVSDNSPIASDTLLVSSETGFGVEALTDRIKNSLLERTGSLAAPTLTRLRHRQGVSSALDEIVLAVEVHDKQFGAELVAEHVRRADLHLKSLTGGIDTEDVLGSVFSQFCIGK